jgi:hypothetical protein
MAHQCWDFDCREECRLYEPHCTRCGRTGTYAGYSLSIIEMWGQYYRFFRLSPLGPQHRIAEEIMGPVTGECRDCRGSGLEAAVSDWGFDDCARCNGTGRIRRCSEEEFERLRQEVLVRAEAAEAAGRQDGMAAGGAQ